MNTHRNNPKPASYKVYEDGEDLCIQTITGGWSFQDGDYCRYSDLKPERFVDSKVINAQELVENEELYFLLNHVIMNSYWASGSQSLAEIAGLARECSKRAAKYSKDGWDLEMNQADMCQVSIAPKPVNDHE